MSVEISYYEKKVIANFSKKVVKDEIKNTFIEIIDTINIKRMKCIIFNFTDITSYTLPKNYIETLKMITHFSVTWNKKVQVLIIATHNEVRKVMNGIVKHSEELVWDYHLFESMDEANTTFPEILALD